jgi:UDP-N-acetylmuramyl pentapeptide phosphotransferase/UDP-N-acetylglucosamine-1-phosphate transferase
VYFRIASHYNIIDKPNERSSHTAVTLRGGGIIFPIAALFGFFSTGINPWFTFGLVAIAIVSFWDDVKNLPARIRIIVHLTAVSLMFYDLAMFNQPWWYITAAYILVIGTINAYNFMDGINGITGLYSLVLLISLAAAAGLLSPVLPLIVFVGIGVLVFLFFNFRKRAKCFAGDVGSVSMAFIALFIILFLISETGNLKYILFLSVYGVDSVLTIIHRLILKENIFKAHRKHLYQYLSNQLKWPHLTVSAIYAVIQLVINIWVISAGTIAASEAAIVLASLGAVYVLIKRLIITGKIGPVTA